MICAAATHSPCIRIPDAFSHFTCNGYARGKVNGKVTGFTAYTDSAVPVGATPRSFVVHACPGCLTLTAVIETWDVPNGIMRAETSGISANRC